MCPVHERVFVLELSDELLFAPNNWPLRHLFWAVLTKRSIYQRTKKIDIPKNCFSTFISASKGPVFSTAVTFRTIPDYSSVAAPDILLHLLPGVTREPSRAECLVMKWHQTVGASKWPLWLLTAADSAEAPH